MSSFLAAEGGYQTFTLAGGEWFVLIASAVVALIAIAVGFFLMKDVLAADQGTPVMIEIAEAIQEGASAYLKRQFRTIAVILIPLAIVVFVTSSPPSYSSLASRTVTLTVTLGSQLQRSMPSGTPSSTTAPL